MKKYSLITFLLVASVAFALAPVTNTSGFRPAGTVIKKVIGSDTFVYDEKGATTMVDLATTTISFAAGAAKKDLAALIPATCSGFEVKVWGDDLVIDNASDLATGSTVYTGWLVTNGTPRVWDGPINGGDMWMAPRTGLVATVTICAW